MAKKYIPYFPQTASGQAILNNFARTRRVLEFQGAHEIERRIRRGMPYYETEKIETVGKENGGNLVLRGECLSACAYLRENNIKVDLVYIDPPFASGADYAKKIYLRRNPKLAAKMAAAEKELEWDELKAFEEKMYGDIWHKADYLSWMHENLMAIKNVMSDTASIFVHLDWRVVHYVRVIMDEVFGEANFRNEIYWYYYNKLHGSRKMVFPRATDTILYYLKDANSDYIFKHLSEKRDEPITKLKYSFVGGKIVNDKDENGKAITYISEDRQIDNVWRLSMLQPADKTEPLDYATQKPETILERIIECASTENMIVADFFGGSGTTAAVAHRLGRKFIHADIGLNSIQTTRDRLKQQKASFDIYEVKDGVTLFRNPIQTMDKLKSLIPGLKNEDGLPEFWEGAVTESKTGSIPVFLPNLLDHTTKILDIPLANKVINIALPELDENKVKKVIVYYVDIEDPEAIMAFINKENPTTIKVELRDLKEILDDVVYADEADIKVAEKNGNYTIELKRFWSDRIAHKIDEHNQKLALNKTIEAKVKGEVVIAKKKDSQLLLSESEGDDNGQSNGEIKISKHGLELIEMVAIDSSNSKGKWHSDTEIKIDKNGYMVLNGDKTNIFWDGTISIQQKPLRLKIRNIAGDETVIAISTSS